jgi:hypothetical protein
MLHTVTTSIPDRIHNQQKETSQIKLERANAPQEAARGGLDLAPLDLLRLPAAETPP